MAEQLGREHDLVIIPVLYEGLPNEGTPFIKNVKSRLSGGRGCALTLENFNILVSANSKYRLSTMIAANGGLLANHQSLGLGDPEDTIEGYVAESLSYHNSTYGVKNSMTIAVPKVQQEISDRYPDIHTIASCIRFTFQYHDDDYDAAFRMSHAVVPMPQDFRRRDFLYRHRDNAHKIMPLLNLTCGNPDRRKCYLHYVRLEALAKGVSQTVLDDPLLLEECLRQDAFPSICKSKHECLLEASRYSRTENAGQPICRREHAIDNTVLIRDAIRAGVWQFKIARSSQAKEHPLKSKTATSLIKMFANEHRRVSVQIPKGIHPVDAP